MPDPSPLSKPEPWDLVADDYAAEIQPMFELFARDALALAAVRAGERIVDVAAGPGSLSLQAAADGLEVTAIDFSPAMLENLRRGANARGLSATSGTGRLDVHLGDGQALPFPDGQFDAGFSMFGLMFFPDRGAGFRELLRVLRPGGRAVVASWGPLEGAFGAMMQAVQAQLPDLPFGRGKGPLSDPDEFAQEMREAGFADVVVQEAVHVLRAPSVDRFWETSQRTTAPLVLLQRNLGPERWADVAAGIQQDLRVRLGDGPIEMVARARLGLGRKSS